MKSQKGVTLISLVIYIMVFSIILAIMANISNYFYRNVSQIQNPPKYVAEFNKFSMFFILDIKRNNSLNQASATKIEFADGTTYEYKDNKIYRNSQEIARYIKKFSFTQSDHTVDSFTKKIVTVNTTIGNHREEITKNIDFVLKYW